MAPRFVSWRDQPVPYVLTAEGEAALAAESENEPEP